jgi:hypothetical protein
LQTDTPTPHEIQVYLTEYAELIAERFSQLEQSCRNLQQMLGDEYEMPGTPGYRGRTAAQSLAMWANIGHSTAAEIAWHLRER